MTERTCEHGYVDRCPPTCQGGWDNMTEPRERDLSGNIIDGAYADGQTKIVSREYPYDDWKAAYDGLRRISDKFNELTKFPNAYDADDRNLIVAGMARTLIKELGL